MSQYSNNSFLSTPNRSAFRRYSLADTSRSAGLLSTPSTLNRSHYAVVKTKIDTVSPGYSSRVVQYNEEKEKSTLKPLKYDKMGVFPIVHFFKKDSPYLHRKNDSNSDLNSSDLTKFNTPEHNRMLLEKIIKSNPNTPNLSPQKSETNAKSVLEALKEISRKRINPSGEEFIMKDDGKRMLDHDMDSARKRLKQNDDTKKPCIDEITASNLSMDMYLRDLYLQEQEAKRVTLKRKHANQLTPPKKITRSVSVETQTHPLPSPDPLVETQLEKDECKEEEKEKEEFVPAIKIFDDGPLEAMRRNRLRVLMGPVKFLDEVADDKTDTARTEETSKPLVSILSTPNKSPQKSTKHVTFDVPETTVNYSTNKTSPVTTNVVTKTSAAINMPIVSASVVAPLGFKTMGHTAEIPQISGPPIFLGNCTMVTAGLPNPPNLSFPTTATSQSKIEDKKNEKTTTENSTPTGGFKFNLKEPEPAPKTTTGFTPPTNSFTPQQKPNFSFGSNVEQKSDKSFPSAFSMEKGQTPDSSTNSALSGFGAKVEPNTDKSFPNAFSLDKNQTSANSTLKFMNTAVTSSFGSKEASQMSFSFGSNLKTFTLPPATVASTSSGFSFNPTTTSTTFGTKPTTTSSNFESNSFEAKSLSNAFSFGSTTKTQEQSTSGFGVAATTSSTGFGVATTTSSFGTPSNSVPSFGANSANLPPAFGTNTNAPSFGTNNTNNVSSFGTSTFGTSNTAPAFGAQANATKIVPAFGTPSNTSLPTFGATTTNSVTSFGGAPNVTTSALPAFGTPTPSTSTMSFATATGSTTNIAFGANKSAFGQNISSYGTTKTTNLFGNSSNATPFNSSTGFGGTTAPAFGSAQNQSNAPFGQTQSSQPFGVTTTASGFGINVTTSSTPFASSYETATGSNETPFGGGGSGGFGSGSTSSSSFGQATNFNFGLNTGSIKPGVFAFGSTEPPKPNFNFQGGGGNGHAFGTGAVVGFGTPFSAQPPAGGMFSIGVGGSSTPTRPRTVYKAKRRT